MTEKDSDSGHKFLGVGVALGLSIGAGVGVALGNVAIGVGIGLAMGVALGSALRKKRANSSKVLPARDQGQDT